MAESEKTKKARVLDQLGEVLTVPPFSKLRMGLEVLPVSTLKMLYEEIAEQMGQAESRGVRFGEKNPRKR